MSPNGTSSLCLSLFRPSLASACLSLPHQHKHPCTVWKSGLTVALSELMLAPVCVVRQYLDEPRAVVARGAHVA